MVLGFFVLFFENWWLPSTISLPLHGHITTRAVLVNIGFIILFGVAHSVMARKWFKQWWLSIIPVQAERSTYILLSSVFIALIIWQWQPFGSPLWDVRNKPIGFLLYGFSVAGLFITAISVFSISVSEFIGWRQSKGETHLDFQPFVTPLFYKYVRHPIYFGFLVAFWCTPLMTPSHLLFGMGMTGYIVIGATLEERSLIEEFGEAYLEYQYEVPMLLPIKIGWWR